MTGRTGPGAASTPDVVALRDVAEDSGFIEAWLALLQDLPASSYFQTPDWVVTWWRHVGRPPTKVAVWRDATGQPDAVVTLSDRRERAHPRLPIRIRFMSNAGSGRPYSADHCGWAVRADRLSDVRAWLSQEARRRPLLLRHLDVETGVPCVPRHARMVFTNPCPRVATATDVSRLNISANFRQQLRRYRRKLDAAGATFRWVAPDEMTPQDIDVLWSLHQSRRSLLDRPSSFRMQQSAELHRDLVRVAGPGRGPSMLLAEHDGTPIGAVYGFLWRDTFFYYQGGWLADWAPMRLGMALHAEAITSAHARGVRTYDLLRGSEDYKYRFGARDRVDEAWLLPRGVSGRLLDLKYRLIQGSGPGQVRGIAGTPRRLPVKRAHPSPSPADDEVPVRGKPG